jgi:Mg/Co/Ni transporter MgtE
MDVLSTAFLRTHPAEAAAVLEAQSQAESRDLLQSVPSRIAAPVLAQMRQSVAARLLAEMPVEQASERLDRLDARTAASLLRHMPPEQRDRCLAGLSTTAALSIRLLMSFPEDSVGACADPDTLRLHVDCKCTEALQRIAAAQTSASPTLIVDDAGQLQGWVAPEAVLRAPGELPLRALMQPFAARLPAPMTLAAALRHEAWKSASVLLVVSHGAQLTGLLTRDALDSAWARAQKRADPPPSSVPIVQSLALGYWSTLSGLLNAAVQWLPAAAPVAGQRHDS